MLPICCVVNFIAMKVLIRFPLHVTFAPLSQARGIEAALGAASSLEDTLEALRAAVASALSAASAAEQRARRESRAFNVRIQEVEALLAQVRLQGSGFSVQDTGFRGEGSAGAARGGAPEARNLRPEHRNQKPETPHQALAAPPRGTDWVVEHAPEGARAPDGGAGGLGGGGAEGGGGTSMVRASMVMSSAATPRGHAPPSPALEATQRQMDGFFSQLPYTCHQNRLTSVGD